MEQFKRIGIWMLVLVLCLAIAPAALSSEEQSADAVQAEVQPEILQADEVMPLSPEEEITADADPQLDGAVDWSKADIVPTLTTKPDTSDLRAETVYARMIAYKSVYPNWTSWDTNEE